MNAVVVLIVKGWLRWVKKETWSHRGRYLVHSNFQGVIITPLVGLI